MTRPLNPLDLDRPRRFLLDDSERRLEFSDLIGGEVVRMFDADGVKADDGGSERFRVIGKPYFEAPTGRWVLVSEDAGLAP